MGKPHCGETNQHSLAQTPCNQPTITVLTHAQFQCTGCYTEKASPTRHRPEHQHNARIQATCSQTIRGISHHTQFWDFLLRIPGRYACNLPELAHSNAYTLSVNSSAMTPCELVPKPWRRAAAYIELQSFASLRVWWFRLHMSCCRSKCASSSCSHQVGQPDNFHTHNT